MMFGLPEPHSTSTLVRVMEVLTLVCYRFSAVARWADGVVHERRQAPD